MVFHYLPEGGGVTLDPDRIIMLEPWRGEAVDLLGTPAQIVILPDIPVAAGNSGEFSLAAQ